jgi:hypothetical protein
MNKSGLTQYPPLSPRKRGERRLGDLLMLPPVYGGNEGGDPEKPIPVGSQEGNSFISQEGPGRG